MNQILIYINNWMQNIEELSLHIKQFIFRIVRLKQVLLVLQLMKLIVLHLSHHQIWIYLPIMLILQIIQVKDQEIQIKFMQQQQYLMQELCVSQMTLKNSKPIKQELKMTLLIHKQSVIKKKLRKQFNQFLKELLMLGQQDMSMIQYIILQMEFLLYRIQMGENSLMQQNYKYKKMLMEVQKYQETKLRFGVLFLYVIKYLNKLINANFYLKMTIYK
ncbi:hypothetical protein IMG5_050810 [Ichthyophthirius multifiliis]|uniref:Uncharacterized protein n=1 Tax=Ichthyophthirius multifiliis TaxID=5932 RepID=G0QMN9_ICHMU|nr:hypothetical protein IMG5_050810 [Ichthyophthirius multifiliis]EGR33514.1 hypothetical protein IMG5_050810 [Ichthyophthirius multifiliis]|eukprot:XP_004037500.1 hypothetical protein IMG5_050810 [Ichthyophthirius multifiliis]